MNECVMNLQIPPVIGTNCNVGVHNLSHSYVITMTIPVKLHYIHAMYSLPLHTPLTFRHHYTGSL